MATAAPELNIRGVHLESDRIIKANSRHFLALSAIFLFPLSFSLFIYPILQLQSSTPPIINPPLQIKTLSLPLIYSLFVFVLTISAVGTITYSTHHGFKGRPVKLVSSIKSLFQTFIPLVATAIVILIPLAVALFLGLGLVVSRSIHEYYHNNSSDYYFIVLITPLSRAVVLIICVVVVVYVQVNWSLASVIVVVESKWGFKALRRSKYLLRGAAGMRRVSLLMMVIYGYTIGICVWSSIVLHRLVNMGDNFSYWWMIIWVLQIAIYPFLLTMFMRTYIFAFTVLYMYCKFMHGELDWEINAKESATEYVSLPFDNDQKDVPDHVVDVAQA